MYDYTQMEFFKIEDVDHEIHILGITTKAIAYSIWIYTTFLILIGPLSPIAVFIYLFISRQFYLARKRGEPIEFGKKFITVSRYFPFFASMLGLDRIIFPEEWYRE